MALGFGAVCAGDAGAQQPTPGRSRASGPARPDAAPLEPGAGAPAEVPLLRARLWNDGKAEISSYATVERRYGILRKGTATLIVVSEPFDPRSLLKVEPGQKPPAVLPVIKLNTIVEVRTGVYTYHQMASVFLRRSDARVVKLTVGSQEWCGVTAKRLEVRGHHKAQLLADSYFGNEGNRDFSLNFDSRAVLGDALPLWLRTLALDKQGVRKLKVLDEQLSNRASKPTWHEAEIRVAGKRWLNVPAGRYRAVEVSVTRASRRDVFWLDEHSPHLLVRWERSDGGRYDLRWSKRAAYWRMNRPQDVGSLEGRFSK